MSCKVCSPYRVNPCPNCGKTATEMFYDVLLSSCPEKKPHQLEFIKCDLSAAKPNSLIGYLRNKP